MFFFFCYLLLVPIQLYVVEFLVIEYVGICIIPNPADTV